MRLSIRYVDDRVVLSDTEAWAYFRLPTLSYEFLGEETRLALATNITLALATIRMRETELHLRVAHRTYPADTWAQDLVDRTPDGPGWWDYHTTVYQHVWAKEFWTKEVYLGVRLGLRGTAAQGLAGLLGALKGAEDRVGLGDPHLTNAELVKWTEQAERVGRALAASTLAARHATSGEITWLIRHTLAGTVLEPRPSAVERSTWGTGEIAQLAEGAVYPQLTRLRLQQRDTEAYAAYLAFARFPDSLPFPDASPWLHHADTLQTCPVEVSSRMMLIPPSKASKDVNRQLAHARDMESHIREAGADAPIELSEQLGSARALEHDITKERLPFVYGWHRLMVAAPDEQMLTDRVDAVIEHYRDLGIDVLAPTGDQYELLHESMPGDRRRVGAYTQRQPLITIAGGMPTATIELGDRVDPQTGQGWVGPYIGETFMHGRTPVHFDPLVAAARNRPTAVAITGEPGGGKTTLALLMIYQMALRGVTIAAIDPKGDAESLVQLLQDQGRKARIMSLAAAEAGLLDPFAFGDDLAAKKTMATETLRLLLPRMSEERESAMIQAVGAVANEPHPSLAKVVDHLKAADDPASNNLGAVLGSMSEMRLASLCFDPHGGTRIDTEGWTTVFTLAGLSLPDSSIAREEYSYEQRLSVALLYLVSQFARRLMNGLDRRVPKAIFLDEAWAVTSTPEGAKLIPEVSRMGRSRNTALILVSQNAGDLLNEQVTNCLSSVFTFCSREGHEVKSVMELLGVEATEDHMSTLRNLGNGECLFRDLDGRTGCIDVDLVSEELLERLNTNPTGTAAPAVAPAQ